MKASSGYKIDLVRARICFDRVQPAAWSRQTLLPADWSRFIDLTEPGLLIGRSISFFQAFPRSILGRWVFCYKYFSLRCLTLQSKVFFLPFTHEIFRQPILENSWLFLTSSCRCPHEKEIQQFSFNPSQSTVGSPGQRFKNNCRYH